MLVNVEIEPTALKALGSDQGTPCLSYVYPKFGKITKSWILTECVLALFADTLLKKYTYIHPKSTFY